MEPNRPIFQGQPELDSGTAVAQESSDDNYNPGQPHYGEGYVDKRSKFNETVYSNQKPSPIMVNRSSVRLSQNMLPRPHHTIEKFKISSIDSKKFKNAPGYQSDIQNFITNTVMSGSKAFT